MKILMVNKFLYPRGGSETYMFQLATYLEKRDHNVHFFGMNDEKNIIGLDKSKLVNNIDFNKSSLRTLLYPFKIIYSIEARKKISDIIGEFKPDIIHLNNYNYQLTPSILYEIRKRKIPVVQTIHDPNLICPYHRLYNFRIHRLCERCKGNSYYNCLITRCIDNSISKSFIGTIEAYLYHILNTYDIISYFICPSNFIASKIVEFGTKRDKVKVLHNFITMNGIDEEKVIKKDYILYFGRISEEKGIKTLLNAINKINYIKLIIAGTGPLDNELNKYGNIEYVGFKNGKELNKLISEALFSIYPSEWYENCPMSVLESQALGTPVIGANIGGIPELIEDSVDGLLFRPGDADDLVNKIKFLYNNRSILEEYSSKCKEKVKRFSIDLYYNELMKIYQCAIESKGGVS